MFVVFLLLLGFCCYNLDTLALAVPADCLTGCILFIHFDRKLEVAATTQLRRKLAVILVYTYIHLYMCICVLHSNQFSAKVTERFFQWPPSICCASLLFFNTHNSNMHLYEYIYKPWTVNISIPYSGCFHFVSVFTQNAIAITSIIRFCFVQFNGCATR